MFIKDSKTNEVYFTNELELSDGFEEIIDLPMNHDTNILECLGF